jgi:hypothetical protein
MKKLSILLSLAAVSIGLQATTAVAQGVPTFDVARTCRAEVVAGQPRTAVDACMADEQKSREQLIKDWEQFASDIKRACTRETTDIAGIRSYVELLTCLEIARDAAKLPKN